MTQEDTEGTLGGQTALVTGGARRIGAALVRALHGQGANVIIHCRQSRGEAEALAHELEGARPGSTAILTADLRDPDACTALAGAAVERWGRLDVLVNNASTFYPTPVGEIDATAFDDLIGATSGRRPSSRRRRRPPCASTAGASSTSPTSTRCDRSTGIRSTARPRPAW
jgi:NAD(P)-dependent dehydrogenase (short-subunit alcohol dehydrogenase family)